MCTTLRKITDIKTIEVSLSSILLKMISKFTCVMMRRWRSEPPHYQRISKDSGARFLAGLSLLWPMILHQSKKVAAKLWKRADMLKNENIAKDATLLVTFEITCWLKLKMRPLDASMHLCIYVFICCKLSTTTTQKRFRAKKYISKGRIVPISDKLVESVDTEIDGVLRIASQPATTMKKSL